MPSDADDANDLEAAFEALWEGHVDTVRRHLLKLGAGPGDLDDLVQEVFLVAHEHGDDLASVNYPEAWLREVARRVAAGYRRRAHRRHEIAYGDPPEGATTPAIDSQLDDRQAMERLHNALAQLDDESRDLVALRELGSLPLEEVASLVSADRKTVSKRLGVALRRLTNIFRSESSLAGPESGVRATRASTPPPEPGACQVMARHRDVSIGLVGTIFVTVWPGAPTIEALELVDQMLSEATAACGAV